MFNSLIFSIILLLFCEIVPLFTFFDMHNASGLPVGMPLIYLVAK